eukprot:2422634-Rhodomonas_salina.2
MCCCGCCGCPALCQSRTSRAVPPRALRDVYWAVPCSRPVPETVVTTPKGCSRSPGSAIPYVITGSAIPYVSTGSAIPDVSTA